jgi:hypothetical protein
LLLLLPAAAWFLFLLILRQRACDWRRAVLAATVISATCVVLGTEILSVPRLITRSGVAIFWLTICVVAFLYMRTGGRHSAPALRSEPPAEGLDRATKACLLASAVIVLLVGITALIAPPDTWDALEYHLPRVSMWISNHNVGFFPTPDYCQLIYSPWSEYAIMHTELLWGTDRFVNVVEFFSLLGSLVAVSLIAKKLGAGPRGQALAALVCATIPEGILEASGPMNTYVVAFWMATAAAFLMEWNDNPTWLNLICAGLATGLAIFTKGTAYVLLPFVLLACWWMGTGRIRVLFLKRSAVFVLLILALNAPQYVRNYEFTGSPLGVPLPVKYPRTEFVMRRVSVRGTAANVLRNVSLHLCTPSRAVNERIERSVRFAIRGLGVDPDDPSQIWIGLPFHMNHFTSNEIIAGNPMHLILFVIFVGAVFWKAKERIRRRWAVLFALGILSSFVLFCALLRWQMWSSRYHLGLFVLGAGLCGMVLEKYLSPRLATGICVALLLPAMLFACTNRCRSLIPWKRVDDVYHPRAELYFTNEHESVAATYISAADFVNRLHCGNVAIDGHVSDPEIKGSPDSFFVYPFLALIHADGRTRKVWYTGVDNLSARYASEQSHPAPCAVVCLDCVNAPQKLREYDADGRSVFGNIAIFSPPTGVR